MHKILILLSMIISFGPIQSQSHNIDSLENVHETAEPLARLDAASHLIQAYLHKDEKKARTINSQMLQESKKHASTYHEAQAYRNEGIFSFYDSDMENAEKHLGIANGLITKAKIDQDKKDAFKIRSFLTMGNIHLRQGEYEKAAQIQLEGIALCEKIRNYETMANYYYNLSHNDYYMNDIEASLEKYIIAYDHARKYNVSEIESRASTMVGQCYMLIDSLTAARKYYRIAINVAEREDFKDAMREGYLNYAFLFDRTEEYDSSFYYSYKSLDVLQDFPNPFWEAQVQMNLARLHNIAGDPAKSRMHYRAYKELAKKGVPTQLDSHFLIGAAELEKNEGNLAVAFDMLKKGMNMRDSISNLENKEKIKSLELEFGKVKAEQKIAAQELEIESRNKRITRLSAALGFSLLGVVTFFLFYQNSKKSRMLADSKVRGLEQDRNLLVLTSTLEGQEAERARIAHDLHDGLGSLLSSVKAHFGRIQDEISKVESLDIYDKAQGMMDNACDEVRRISHNLAPPLLTTHGIAEAIRNLAINISESHQIEIIQDVRNMDVKLRDTKAIFIYRIIQELLTNVVKHANADKVELHLYGLEDNIQIIVEDNGRGYNTASENKGLGLTSISSRVEFLAGDLEIESEIGKGTTVIINIPIRNP